MRKEIILFLSFLVDAGYHRNSVQNIQFSNLKVFALIFLNRRKYPFAFFRFRPIIPEIGIKISSFLLPQKNNTKKFGRNA